MQIGCTLLSPQDLDAAKETGFDYAEFMGKYLVSLSSSEYLELQRAVKRSRLQVAGINGYCPETVKIGVRAGNHPEICMSVRTESRWPGNQVCRNWLPQVEKPSKRLLQADGSASA